MNILKQQEARHQALGNPPPSSLAHVFMLADAGKGLSPTLKVGCQPTSGWEEDAMLVPTWAVGQESPADSLNHDPARYSGRGLRRSVTRNLGRLISDVRLLFGAASRRRRSLALALGLLRLSH